MKILRARHTGIKEMLDAGDGFIVLENFENFPTAKANLYKVTYGFEPIWEAELPKADSAFLNNLKIEKPGVLKAFTWDDCRCFISISSGKLLEHHWTK